MLNYLRKEVRVLSIEESETGDEPKEQKDAI